jgi:hypothetical protein
VTVTVETKKKIIRRDGFFCLMALPGCNGEAQTTHHRANRGSGGSTVLDDPVNLVAVCVRCNGRAEDAGAILRMDLIERGLRVEKAATNEQTLARSRSTSVEYLDGERFYLLSATERINVHNLMREAR